LISVDPIKHILHLTSRTKCILIFPPYYTCHSNTHLCYHLICSFFLFFINASTKIYLFIFVFIFTLVYLLFASVTTSYNWYSWKPKILIYKNLFSSWVNTSSVLQCWNWVNIVKVQNSCSENHTKHINTVHEETVKMFNISTGGVSTVTVTLLKYNSRKTVLMLWISFRLGGFARSRKSTVSYFMSVCLFACNNSPSIGRIFMKFGFWVFFKICLENATFTKVQA